MTENKTDRALIARLLWLADHHDLTIESKAALREAADLLASQAKAEPVAWQKGWTGEARVNLTNDAWVKVWQDAEWVIVHTRTGGSETTVSLRRDQAFQIAYALTPELLERFNRARTAEHALWEFQNVLADPAELRWAAEEVDCGPECEGHDSRRQPCHERGNCRFIVAETLRDFATALERKAALPAAPSAPAGDTRTPERADNVAGPAATGRGPLPGPVSASRSGTVKTISMLQAALQPFAEAAKNIDAGCLPDNQTDPDTPAVDALWGEDKPTVGDLRRARAALASTAGRSDDPR